LAKAATKWKLPVVNAAAVSTTQCKMGQSGKSSVLLSCNQMWGKLDMIGAGRMFQVGIDAESTGTSMTKINGFLEGEGESKEDLAGIGLIPMLANTASFTRSLLASLICA
jgi:hypothetical protein